jgi:peptidoglycan/xylan/chitin deacetylase (PgdA/CDA1 family)
VPPSATPAAKGTLCLTFDNMGRAMEIARGKASTPDDNEPGFAVGYPRLLGLLDSLGLHGTFFIEGWNALHHADRILDLVKRGHEVGLHGWIHEDFAALDRLRAEQYLHDGAAAMNRIGVRPSGFRAPGGYRGEHTIDILRTLGFRYDSSTVHDQTSQIEDSDFAGTLEPSWLAPGLAHVPWRYSMVDSIQYLRHRERPRTPAELQQSWLAMIDRAAATATTMTLVVHAYVSGVDEARFEAVRNVLTHAARRTDLVICNARDLVGRLQARP